MIGERLAELRKLNGETQEDLAKAFHVSVPTVRTWERDKASPSHEVLIALCKRYGTSADYLLGLTDIDPSDEARKQSFRFIRSRCCFWYSWYQDFIKQGASA